MKVGVSQVKMFKIKNRRGYAAVCKSHLTEGRTPYQAYYRMGKALKRNGLLLSKIESGRAKRLVKTRI